MINHDYAIEAMHDGSHARRAGLRDCPHPPGTPERRFWWQGWWCVDRALAERDEWDRRAAK